jgi:hypothetical protein
MIIHDISDSHTTNRTNRTIRKPREAQMLRDRQRQNRTGRIMGLLQNLEPKWKHRWVTSKYAGESWWITIVPILSPLKWPGYAIFIYGAMKSGRMWPVCGRPAQWSMDILRSWPVATGEAWEYRGAWRQRCRWWWVYRRCMLCRFMPKKHQPTLLLISCTHSQTVCILSRSCRDMLSQITQAPPVREQEAPDAPHI